MKVTFTQSGGYTGLVRGVVLDTRDLPEDERRHLESLVRNSGLSGLEQASSSRARDAHQYVLIIEEGPVKHVYEFDDTTKPAAALELIRELRARSKPQRLA